MTDNKKRIKKITAYVLACVFSFGMLFLSACQKEEKPGVVYYDVDYLTVGFSQVGAESDWRVANTESIKNSLSRYNGIDLIFDDAQQKQDKQILAIRKFIQQEVDYIVLAPVTETGWDTVLGEAGEAGIPVIIVDRKVDVKDDSLYKAWVGSDFARESEIACLWLKAYADRKHIRPEDINIVDIQGTLGATAQIGRTSGLESASYEYGWNILASVPADYAQSKAEEVMTDLLRRYPEVNVVYCENDNEALGTIDAIEKSGRKAGTDITKGEILIISFDATHAGLTKVLEKKIALDVECNPLQGETIRDLIKSVDSGEEFPKYTYVEEKAFSADETVSSIKLSDSDYEITLLTGEILEERQY